LLSRGVRRRNHADVFAARVYTSRIVRATGKSNDHIPSAPGEG
jgi:hypothetical protein